VAAGQRDRFLAELERLEAQRVRYPSGTAHFAERMTAEQLGQGNDA
jgi:hypothetical protein